MRSQRTMRRCVWPVALLLIATVGLVALAEESTKTTVPTIAAPDLTKVSPVPVVRIVDGDTIVVLLEGANTKVRLVGVDTPETVHPSKPVEWYGKEASRFEANLLQGEKVFLVKDPTKPETTDRYGRLLAYVYRAPDGLFVNAEIIRQGYGHAYIQYPFRYMEEFRQLERFAREAGKGLWGASLPDPAATAPLAAPTEAPKPSAPALAPPAAPPTVTKSATPPVLAPATNDPTVYVTRTGAKYHTAGCRYLSKSQIPMKLSEAKQRYGPCSVCNPPQ